MSLGWIEGVIQGAQQDKGIQTNAWFMNENQKWSEFMAQHNNQFMVQDLKAAGLNPMLAYGKNAPMPGPMGQAPSGHSAFRMEALLMDAQRRNIDADTMLKTASAGQAAAQTQKVQAELPKIQAEIERINEESGLIRVDRAWKEFDLSMKMTLAPIITQLMRQQVPKSQNEADAQASWWKKNVAPYLPDLGSSANSAASLYQLVK